MALQFELAGAQIDGARDYQEDAFLITNLTDAKGNASALVVVADGMGGHAAGNVASNMAVQAINKHMSANYPTDDIASILHECVIKANNSIKETVKETPALEGMGCTMVCAVLEDGKLWWASVGDSHLYLIRNKELHKKNADHSYGGFLDRMAAAGTPVEPEPGLARNMLMSAITGDEINEIDIPEEPFQLEAGDRVLLCSDGLDTLSDGKIIQFSEWSESPKECAEALLQAVEDAGMPKQDNTTAVVVNVAEKVTAEAAQPTPPPAPPAPPVEPAPAPAAPAAAPADTTQDLSIEETRPAKSKTGMMVGIAAAVIIAIGVVGYLVMGGKKQAAPTGQAIVPSATTTAPPQPATTPPAETAQQPAPATTPPKTTAAPPAASTAATQPAPAATPKQAKPAPAPAAVPTTAGKPFHDTLKDGTPGPEMVWIPAGTFEMGSRISNNPDERPVHTVSVKKFAISEYEITFAQYDKFARATGRKLPDNEYLDKATYPAFFVSWDDAYYYARWLSKQTGKDYYLPSESQWEYAAGAGKRSTYWWGYDVGTARAHCVGCGDDFDPRKPTKIGSFKPNPFGIYDTSGNVAEWVQDCWHDNYDGAPADGSVWEGGDCNYRVVRGGSFSSPPGFIRHTHRDKFKSDQGYDTIGIRVARSP